MTGPVAARLASEVLHKRLSFDAAQQAAALRLDALAAELQLASSGMRRLRGALPRLLGGAGRRAPRGVYLCGSVGGGKTMLMDFFQESLPVVQRSHFYRFMQEVHARLGRIHRRTRPLDIVARHISARTKVLCLDEFYVGDIADAMLLGGLLQGLFRRGVTLVTTSNVAPQDLYKDGLQRQRFLAAIELLHANLDVVMLGGAIDYRLRQLDRAPIYLDSALPQTHAALRERFSALSRGGGPDARTLRVNGRQLRAVHAGPGIVWFEFRELCAGPRSQSDYIEIARLHQTVFVENVPIFGPADDDAARRFIMLIDEFYDCSVKMVISAAAVPAKLYRGERLEFEFARTTSRLIEMQSLQYLGAAHRPGRAPMA
ncbi:MAG: cell division protein ZapE [Pseudomonadota bacterium]|nr:cell division protein ZapE [Pseudomonadota bacterium]